jgi:hypothetical protein
MNDRFTQKRSFDPGRPNVRFAPIADIQPTSALGH